ncbi:MAG: HD domain-containing protein [Lachnospiraceae bacterium]|nr:HD domain-containing protein [Lachnospiraceae bacterium]
MDDSNRLSIFREYAGRIHDVRQLSSPAITEGDTAENYSTRLKENFRRIGEIAAINRRMLDEELYPLIESSDSLDKATAEDLNELADLLLSITEGDDECENLDLTVSSIIMERLLTDAEQKDDICNRIRRMDSEATVCYSMINMTSRITSDPAISRVYIDKGIAIGQEFICMLDKDFFLMIPDLQMRETVLTNARFSACFFERYSNSDEMNRYNLDILDKMMDISEDEFYHKAVPDFDWRYFKYRTLEYYIMSTEIDNMRGFSEELLKRIEERTYELEKLIASDPEYFTEIPGEDMSGIHVARCRYLAGTMSKEEYRKCLLETYDKRDREDFGVTGALTNTMIPLEFICLMDKDRLSSEDVRLLKRFYQGITYYLFHSPNTGVLSYILEYPAQFIYRFIDIPSGIDFEEFLLQCIAAIHPPTYIHSRMVGQITESLVYHLLRTEPERFIGFPGCATVTDVLDKQDEILYYSYHAALCHDFGKISIIDTIFVYGRKLLDMEFNIIKTHPMTGADLLRKHSRTAEYADVALGHHKWYDNKGGYPADVDTSKSPYKTVIDIVLCADCMDAATDTVGRSYSRGKTLDGFLQELREGAGTRYAPWLPSLLAREEVFADVESILVKDRELNYRDTYSLLKEVQEKG